MAIPTIKEVAREAGVSVTTVSRVLNGVPGVREETRSRVERVIQRLGYRPNSLARSLVTRKSRTIGLLVRDITNPFYPEMARAIEDAVNRLGYHLILCNTDASPRKEQAYLDLLREQRVAGIIFSAPGLADRTVKHLQATGDIPFVLAVRRVPGVETDTVTFADRDGARQAVEHLAALGHRRIGHIAGPSDSWTARERREGYRQTLTRLGLPLREGWVVRGDLTRDTGRRAMARLLTLSERPTAVFCANDLMALGAWEAVLAAGLRVPEDVALVGFDGVDWAGFALIGLTTVAVPKYDLGDIAAQLLIRRIEGDMTPPQDRVLSVSLVVRRSSAGGSCPESAQTGGDPAQ